MLVKYARKQRASIYHPATIDDLPFEVLREALLYLEPAELVAPSRVNRSWRPAAQDVQRARVDFPRVYRSLMCGIQLTRIVFGYDVFSIKHLEIDFDIVSNNCLAILARLISPTLHTLDISFADYEILDQFFSHCRGIRNLKLQYFDFGDDLALISQTIKGGFYQLSQLSLLLCRGDLRMFVVSVPILNLLSFSIDSFGETIKENNMCLDVALNCPMIKRLYLDDYYTNSTTLLKIVESCRDIEELSFVSDDIGLIQSDFEAFASLPRLKSLYIDCRIVGDGVTGLSRCRGLKHLALLRGSFALTSIFTSIGRKFVSLKYTTSNPYLETVYSIIEHCPNIQILDLDQDAKDKAAAGPVDLLKEKLKMLTNLKIGKESVRLGTALKSTGGRPRPEREPIDCDQ
jgi:hypothetical protein